MKGEGLLTMDGLAEGHEVYENQKNVCVAR